MARVPTYEATRRRVRRAVDPEREGRLGVLLRATQRYIDDGMLERAPTLAYYGILSLFPLVLLAYSAVRLFAGDTAAADIATYVRESGASGAVTDAVRSAIETAQKPSESSAGAAGVVSLLTLIYGASRAFTATGRAIDAIGRRERQPRSLARRAQDIAWTLVLLLIGMVCLALATLSGKVLKDLLGLVGVSPEASTVWAVARWPLAAALAVLIVAVVRWAAPTGDRRPFRLLSPGQIVTVGSLVVATAGFDLYLTYLASYNATYGAFAGAVIVMLWIWQAGSALLFGAEVDAVLERHRARPTEHVRTP
jgi:membrane protein